MRSLIDIVSESFIWAVGITRPKEHQKRFAAFYISGFLAAAILGVAALFLFLVTRL